jgi:hypothetical protein
MDSTFTKREIYGEMVVREPVTTITLVHHNIMGGHLVVASGTQVTSEISADTLSEVTICLVFEWRIYGGARSLYTRIPMTMEKEVKRIH